MVALCGSAFADEPQTFTIMMNAVDGWSGEPMFDAKGFMLSNTTGDTIFASLSTPSFSYGKGDWIKVARLNFKLPKKIDSYTLKAYAEGYDTVYSTVELDKIGAREYQKTLPDLEFYRKAKNLGTATVTATKVKFYHSGDTLIYNADAFKLPEGSMLDALINQLPGVEMNDDGEIFVNGKKVESLLLNGKDFFKGDNKVMLENLPYFTVKNVQVYHKSTEKSELAGRDIEEKEYVMDVKLKREYARGYIANAEAGAGTEQRWMGRAFGLYYDDHTRMSAFANINNVNEDRKPGNDGEWKPADMPRGLLKTRQVGIDLDTEDKEKTFNNRFSSTLTWRDADNRTNTASENFASDGSIYRGSSSKTLIRPRFT